METEHKGQDLGRIRSFLEQTEKRIKELEAKDKLERAEEIELEMCKSDVVRAKAALGED